MNLVSVVIPIYNDGKYLMEALNSALNQSYSNLEVIIVNDGSTDRHTIDVLNSISNPKVQVINKENGHLSSARNTGIKIAKGEYILTLDADDKFEPSFVQKAIQVINKSNDVKVITCYVRSFGLSKKKWKPCGGGFNNFILENSCCGNAFFLKRDWERVGGYDENMKLGLEDWDFWLRILAEGGSVYVLKEFLFNYRVKENSMFLTQSNPNKSKILKYMYGKHAAAIGSYLSERVSDYKMLDIERGVSYKRIIKLLIKKIIGKLK